MWKSSSHCNYWGRVALSSGWHPWRIYENIHTIIYTDINKILMKPWKTFNIICAFNFPPQGINFIMRAFYHTNVCDHLVKSNYLIERRRFSQCWVAALLQWVKSRLLLLPATTLTCSFLLCRNLWISGLDTVVSNQKYWVSVNILSGWMSQINKFAKKKVQSSDLMLTDKELLSLTEHLSAVAILLRFLSS